MSFYARARPRVTPYPLPNMGRIADRLRALTAEMRESDERLQRLINEHVSATTANLEELKRLNK